MSHGVEFVVKTPDGDRFIGYVQGCGGLIGAAQGHLPAKVREAQALERLLRMVELANERKPLGVPEPRPGCVMFYPEWDANGPGPIEAVPLRGAKVLVMREL